MMTTWGIHGEPVGVRRLRESFQHELGGEPDDDQVSRELIALRGDRRP
jgi:hypothetical protein